MGRMLAIDLDANTEEEVSTDEEDCEQEIVSEDNDRKDIAIINTINDRQESIGKYTLLTPKMSKKPRNKPEIKLEINPDSVKRHSSDSLESLEPIAGPSKQQNCEPIAQSVSAIKGETKEQLTDSRYLWLSSDLKDIDLDSGLTPLDSYRFKKSPDRFTLKTRYICSLCDPEKRKKYREKQDLIGHRNNRHPGPDLLGDKARATAYIKYTQLVEKKAKIKRKRKIDVVNRHKSPKKSAKDKQNKADKPKRKKKAKANKTSEKSERPTDVSLVNTSDHYSAPISTVSSNGTQFRILQKCKICSFAPIMNTMVMIRDHIIHEHNIQQNFDLYHESVMLKVKPT